MKEEVLYSVNEGLDRIIELRSHLYETRLDRITKAFMEGMSVDLREWITESWPVHEAGGGRAFSCHSDNPYIAS